MSHRLGLLLATAGVALLGLGVAVLWPSSPEPPHRPSVQRRPQWPPSGAGDLSSLRPFQPEVDKTPHAVPAAKQAAAPIASDGDTDASDGGDAGTPRGRPHRLGDPTAPGDNDTVAPAGEPAPAAPRPIPDSPRYRVRWGQTGLCDVEGLGDVAATRAATHARFLTSAVGGLTLSYDPSVPAPILRLVADAVPTAQEISARLLAYFPEPPDIYIYADLDQLRAAACVNQASVAYYDGDLHVTGDFTVGHDQIHKSVVHELIHHSLLGMRISVPMWLQEGLAIYAADETWWQQPELGLMQWLRNEHLPFYLMTRAFPHTADELFAGAAYYQSFEMVRFIIWRHGEGALGVLAEQLARGEVPAIDAFAIAAGLRGNALEEAWSEYVAEI